jgi:hypothetical protein
MKFSFRRLARYISFSHDIAPQISHALLSQRPEPFGAPPSQPQQQVQTTRIIDAEYAEASLVWMMYLSSSSSLSFSAPGEENNIGIHSTAGLSWAGVFIFLGTISTS